MLKIQGLKKKFGNFEALSGLDMEVEEGALYGFVGPNGAGKTTAIRIITGLLKADEGTVMIGGLFRLLLRTLRPCGERAVHKASGTGKTRGKRGILCGQPVQGNETETLPGAGHDPRSEAPCFRRAHVRHGSESQDRV